MNNHTDLFIKFKESRKWGDYSLKALNSYGIDFFPISIRIVDLNEFVKFEDKVLHSFIFHHRYYSLFMGAKGSSRGLSQSIEIQSADGCGLPVYTVRIQ